jgi:hypothetical protein
MFLFKKREDTRVVQHEEIIGLTIPFFIDSSHAAQFE